MKLITKTRVRRALIPLAALAVAAAIVPTAGAADCTMAPGANCQNQDMRHLGNAMKGADMTGADMRGADMRNMDMTNINLTNADLRGAKLSGAKMNGANLSGAKMTGIKMTGTKMRGVMMKGTKLNSAVIKNVTFDHAMMDGVDIRGTRFVGGGMTNSNLLGMKAGSGKRLPSTRSFTRCSDPPSFNGSGIGWAWERDYNFNGSTFTGDWSCTTFNAVTWGSATFQDADFTYTEYYNSQNNSDQIIAVNTDFSWSKFNTGRFWSPALAYHVNLSYATCPASISGDQSNAIWGRYNYTSPYYIGATGKGIWKYGVVTSTAFGNIQFASQPVVVSATDARLAVVRSGQDGKRPYLTLTSSTNCRAQTAPDWQGGGY